MSIVNTLAEASCTSIDLPIRLLNGNSCTLVRILFRADGISVSDTCSLLCMVPRTYRDTGNSHAHSSECVLRCILLTNPPCFSVQGCISSRLVLDVTSRLTVFGLFGLTPDGRTCVRECQNLKRVSSLVFPVAIVIASVISNQLMCALKETRAADRINDLMEIECYLETCSVWSSRAVTGRDEILYRNSWT
jgi:hypothetical protein